ncbi:hypothetical protein K501DRAFT_272636 [Backusella circina FSU 941]|nr:hypothetical protein K501DRAFT_272636 [Backusella circina FSU 941]
MAYKNTRNPTFHYPISLSLFHFSYASYGPLEPLPDMKIGKFPAVFRVGRDIYSYGRATSNISKFGIDENKNLYAKTYYVEDLDFKCFFCFNFVMRHDSVLILTGYDSSVGANHTDSTNMGVFYFDPLTNSGPKSDSYKILQGSPKRRLYFQAVITPDKKSIYIFGGFGHTSLVNVNTSIVQFDISTSTFTNHDIFPFVGGTATMLPSGVVVLAFGSADINQPYGKALYGTSSVYLYDTNTNELYKSILIGNNFDFLINTSNNTVDMYGDRLEMRSDLVVLNTTSWTWFHPNISGLPSKGIYNHFSLLYEDNSLIIGGGLSKFPSLQNDISVLKNLPTKGDSLGLDHLQWFTNSELDSTYNVDDRGKLEPGTISGIIIGTAILLIIILYILLKKFEIVKGFIWKKRLGEPIWIEILRTIIGFVLFGILIAYIVYSIIRAMNSPSINQEQIIEKKKMPLPDIRICSKPYTEFSVSCAFENNEDCSRYFYPIKDEFITPRVDSTTTETYCQVFIPPLDIYFRKDDNIYKNEQNEKMLIQAFKKNITTNTKFYSTYYTSQNSPYRTLFGMNSDDSEMTLDDANAWLYSENGTPNLKNAYDFRDGDWIQFGYSLAKTRFLTNSSWNYFGFASIYDTTYSITQKLTSRSVPSNYESLWDSVFVLTIYPNEFSIRVVNEQRVFTILGGLASAGGVFSVIIAIQTLLFGFRPDSPWGIVHRWSCGRQRRTLRDQLRDQFNPGDYPVPMVTRLCDDYHLRPTSSDSTTIKIISLIENDDDQSDGLRLRRMEERIQLMEDLFKTYYIDNEIFQSLNEARRNNPSKDDWKKKKMKVKQVSPA